MLKKNRRISAGVPIAGTDGYTFRSAGMAKGRIPFSARMGTSRLRPRTRNRIVIKQDAKERHQRRMIMIT
jgi:hypothetical protein